MISYFVRYFLLVVVALMSLSTVFVSAQKSPYLSKVYDFQPAPGQFVNQIPEYEPGDTKADIIRKAEEYLANNARVMVSLGAWGGYIVFGFDHPVVNKKGHTDFKVLGNTFQEGGSSEPGIVFVSYDANQNGVPDDEWYELAGSEYTNPKTIHNYQIKYYKPSDNHQAVPDPEDRNIIDSEYIRWEDNRGAEGYVKMNVSHLQTYWPEWMNETELSFEGTRLPDNYEKLSLVSYYLHAYDWGYADNKPNDDTATEMNIEWAVDKNGNPVHLDEIHFIKVQTGLNQHCGWIGESSTEITGAVDLHPDAETGLESFQTKDFSFSFDRTTNQLQIISPSKTTAIIYSITGAKLKTLAVYPGNTFLSCSDLPKGIYIVAANQDRFKFIR